MPMSELVRVDRRDHIATVTLASATMPPAFFGAVEATFDELSRDRALRAVVIRGSARCFSYGLDLPATFAELGPMLQGGLAAARADLLALIRRWQRGFDAIARSPVPVIAAVNGWCIGGGLDLATACDVRLASADARFSLRETKIAIVADLGSLQRLPMIVGRGHAREMAYTGRDVDADRARAIGLVNDVLPDVSALHAAADRLADEVAANPPLTVRGVKDVLDRTEGRPVDEGLAYVAAWNAAFLASEDLGEAMSAFFEKRPPHWQGR